MKTQNPWMGRVKGSAGNMTGCKVYDKNVLRAKAFEVSNPNTSAQQVQRDFFKQLAATCATFSEDELRFLFPQKPKSMSRRNAISKQLASDAVMDEGEKFLDFANIDTLGNAPTMDFGTTVCDNDGTNITVTLDPIVSDNETYGDYVFVAALVNVIKGEITMPLVGATVETGVLEIPLPDGWESADEVNAIPLITNKKGNAALVGYGTMIVNKRPPKKGPAPEPPLTTLTIHCSGLNTSDTFSFDTTGTVAEGLTPSTLVDDEDTVCSSFNDLGNGSFTGSFVKNTSNELNPEISFKLPNHQSMSMPVVFEVD